MFSKLWKVAGVAAAGLALLSPTVARAQVDPGVLSDGAAFTGQAVTVPPVQQTGGTGSFTYDSIAGVCFSDVGDLAETGVETPAGNVGANCHVHATGTYANIVCGTGSAGGTGSVAGENANFNILFVATIGVLAGTLGDSPGDPADINPEQLLGVVQLGPPPGLPPAPPNCTNGFTATVVAVALECTPVLLPNPPGTIPPWSLGPIPPTCAVLS